jgi:hypothetical protein
MNNPIARNRSLRITVCVALLGVTAIACARSYASNAAARNILSPQAASPASPPAPSQQQSAPAQQPPAEVPKLTDGVVYQVLPHNTDARITRYNAPNLVLFKHGVARNAPLLVFFSGTGGTPASGWPFLEAGANAGYRVIGLTYDNAVSDPQTCGPNPDPACSDRFRQKRIFGDDVTKDIDDLPAESIVNRLTKLLEYLDAEYPGERWSSYIDRGQPNWSRIAVSGHSQGGGVAAYIAKKVSVYRVINLSGAWDRTEATKEWAPWITSPSATPMDRWYAAYHQKESRADAMKAAYAVLKIPPDHIRVLTLEPVRPPNAPPGADLYHGSMASPTLTPRDANGNPAYAADWAFLLGNPR